MNKQTTSNQPMSDKEFLTYVDKHGVQRFAVSNNPVPQPTEKPLDKTDYHPAPGVWRLPDPVQPATPQTTDKETKA